ncbi:hypothetical protein GQ457_10G004770 [Hibiscus cannabinus]
MRSCFAVFCPDFKFASQLREKTEASSIAENRFDRDSNGIVDALKHQEDILKMGGVGKMVFHSLEGSETQIQYWSLFHLQVIEFLVCVHVFALMLYRNRLQATIEIVRDLFCDHSPVVAEVVADFLLCFQHIHMLLSSLL